MSSIGYVHISVRPKTLTTRDLLLPCRGGGGSEAGTTRRSQGISNVLGLGEILLYGFFVSCLFYFVSPPAALLLFLVPLFSPLNTR